MKTRILSLVVALFATITLYAYDFQYGDLYYNITSESTVEVVHNESYSELTVVVIPSTLYDYYVTSVGDSAFFGCTGLTSITIPNRVTSIGYQAFEDCTGLTSVTIGNSVTSIGYETFKGCTGLTSITIPNSVTEIGWFAFSGCTGLTSITIPNSVTEIGSSAFEGCTGLTSITIPNSVTEIENSAFSGCTGLTSITIPNSVTSIEYGAFSGCTGLTSIVVENGNKVYDSRSNCNAIIETATNTLIQGCKTTIIPNSVTSIGSGAFSGCTGLTSITIPNSVTSIGGAAFSGCTGLTSVIIPNSVTSIEEGAFSGCTGLTSITIPNSVTSIGWAAFSGCTGLTSVLIGNNSELSMDDATFFGYANLTQVTCYANVPPHIYIGQPGYFDEDKLSEKTLYVPLSAIGKYKEADVWKDFGQIVPIGATATDTDEPVIMPSYTEVTIAWPTTIGAKTYTITITKDAKTISSLTFDNTGVLINAAFAAPSYNGNARQAPAAQYAQSAFWFTFSGLECNTQYEYSIVAKSSNGQPISTYNGTFRTTAPTAIDNVSSSSSNNAAVQTRKVFRNGQVLIQHNGKTYTISGNEVK